MPRYGVGDLPCHSASQHGYATTARINDAALLIATPTGISVFPAGTR